MLRLGEGTIVNKKKCGEVCVCRWGKRGDKGGVVRVGALEVEVGQ